MTIEDTLKEILERIKDLEEKIDKTPPVCPFIPDYPPAEKPNPFWEIPWDAPRWRQPTVICSWSFGGDH